MYAHVTDNTITDTAWRLPRAARRLDTGQWVLGLPHAATRLQQACGWREVTETERPDDTDTTTHERTIELVDGTPTAVWTERPLTDRELFDRELSAAPDTLTTIAARLNPAEPPTWKQPTGAHDAHLPGAVVVGRNGDRWRNDLGIPNVWPLDNPHARWTNLDAEPHQGDGPIPWEPGLTLTTGDQVTYDGVTYDVVQGHTTQAGWTPPAVPALFAAV